MSSTAVVTSGSRAARRASRPNAHLGPLDPALDGVLAAWPSSAGLLRHGLVGHHLFDGPRLAMLAERLGTGALNRGTWLANLESDPEYRRFLESFVRAVCARLPGEPEPRTLNAELLVASPGTGIPACALDEDTLLIQLYGRLTVGIVAADGAVPNRRGSSHVLRAGSGLLVPAGSSPALARMSCEAAVSMTLRVSWHTAESERMAGVRHVNEQLRQAGFLPSEPGQSVARDAVKYAVYRGLRRLAGRSASLRH